MVQGQRLLEVGDLRVLEHSGEGFAALDAEVVVGDAVSASEVRC